VIVIPDAESRLEDHLRAFQMLNEGTEASAWPQ